MLMVHFTGHLVCNMGRAPQLTIFGLLSCSFIQKDIAEILGVTPSAVSQSISKAQKILQECLSNNGINSYEEAIGE